MHSQRPVKLIVILREILREMGKRAVLASVEIYKRQDENHPDRKLVDGRSTTV